VRWWLDSARRLDAAGYAGVWSWDHFVSRGVRTDPVLEAWTTLTAAAMVTERVTVGTFVANVMNRHPAVVARMAAMLQEASGGRLVLGIVERLARVHRDQALRANRRIRSASLVSPAAILT
jgi:alkanesulfonate monooxygenase SsuD/methylene tetrahydromethanopterin reductase-like flavin-dependent oxidoreductase (luciferase family)